jgi:hypothetical protein
MDDILEAWLNVLKVQLFMKRHAREVEIGT